MVARVMATTRTTLNNTSRKRRSIRSSANNSIYRYQAPYKQQYPFVPMILEFQKH